MNIPGAMYITEVQPHSHSTIPLALCLVIHIQTPYQGHAVCLYFPVCPAQYLFLMCLLIVFVFPSDMPSGDDIIALPLDIQRLEGMKKKERKIACNKLGILCMPGTLSPGVVETRGILSISGL